MPRIAPAESPYEPQIAEALARIMPPGMEPLLHSVNGFNPPPSSLHNGEILIKLFEVFLEQTFPIIRNPARIIMSSALTSSAVSRG